MIDVYFILTHSAMEGAGNDFILLFLGKLIEVYRIAGYTDCKLRVLFRMSLGIQQGFFGKNIYIQMVSAFLCISIQQRYQIINLSFICMSHMNVLLI